MIERHVYVKFRPEHSGSEAQQAAVERTRALAAIPGVTSVRVGVPADGPSAAAWDVCLVITFASLEAVEPYRVHPIHKAYLTEFLDPRAEVKKAWNFEV